MKWPVEFGDSIKAQHKSLDDFSSKFWAPSSLKDDDDINDKNCLTVSLSSLKPRFNCRVSLAKQYKCGVWVKE